MRKICVVSTPARRCETSISRFVGCQATNRWPRNSLYRATARAMLAGTGGMPWATRLALGATTSAVVVPGGDDESGAHAATIAAARQAAARRARRIGENGMDMKKGAALDGGALIVIRRPSAGAAAPGASGGHRLLDAGDRPLAAAVGRLDEVPHLVERLGDAVVLFTDEAVEADADDLALG